MSHPCKFVGTAVRALECRTSLSLKGLVYASFPAVQINEHPSFRRMHVRPYPCTWVAAWWPLKVGLATSNRRARWRRPGVRTHCSGAERTACRGHARHLAKAHMIQTATAMQAINKAFAVLCWLMCAKQGTRGLALQLCRLAATILNVLQSFPLLQPHPDQLTIGTEAVSK
jgi:hypothetical protein